MKVFNPLTAVMAGLVLSVGFLIAHAQSSSLPAATPTSATIPWAAPSNCTSTNTCQYQVYRNTGACPGTLAGSTGWALLTTTTGLSYTDTSVVGGTQYSYDIEALPTGSTSVYSGPSNCGSTTIPFTPVPPVIGTITAQ
jgi:hypothetical protein